MRIKQLKLPRSRIADALIVGTALSLAAIEGGADDGTSWSNAPSRSHAFQVWLDDRMIGRHEFIVSGHENATRVKSNLELELKIWFATLYSYSHEANELWQGPCLTAMQSKTRTKGKDFTLDASGTGDQFVIKSTRERKPLVDLVTSECVGSYAYWDRTRLERGAIMNAQTGRLSAASLEPLGASSLPRTTAQAQHYRLKTDEADFLLWYGETGEWLGLETTTEGRTLTYVSERLAGAP